MKGVTSVVLLLLDTAKMIAVTSTQLHTYIVQLVYSPWHRDTLYALSSEIKLRVPEHVSKRYR